MQSTRQQAGHPRPFAHPVRNIAALGVQDGMHVADFGSGSGAYVLAIAEAMHGTGRVYAVDIQQDLLRRIGTEARRRDLNNVEPVWADLEGEHASKLADVSLDLVLISNLMFQIEDKRVVLADAWRVLHPTGKLVVIDWRESYGGMGPQKQDVVTKDAMRTLAEEAHFALVREFEAGAHHYGLVFRPVPRSVV